MLFSSFQDAVTVKRLTQTNDQSAYATVSGVTYYGFFRPVDTSQNIIALRITGQAYQFTTDGANDIRNSDILTYNSEEYGVLGVKRMTQKGIDTLDCFLEKRQKYS